MHSDGKVITQETFEGMDPFTQHLKEFNYTFMKFHHFPQYIASNALFGIKCIELTGFFSVFEASLYRNYIEFSNKLNSIIRAIFVLFNSLNRLHI